MVAVKRDDGLYEVPGLSFAVPYEYVPDAHKPPPEEAYNQTQGAPPPEPDLRLADNSFQNRTGQPIDLQAHDRQQQEAQAKSDAVNNLFAHPPSGEQLAAYQRPQAAAPQGQKVALEPGPGEQAGEGVRPARTPMDNAFAAQVMRSFRGSYTPGGDKLTAQQWQNSDEAVNPSERNAPHVLTNPETGEPLTRIVEGSEWQEPGVKRGKGAEKVSPEVAKAMMSGYQPGTFESPDRPGRFHQTKKSSNHVEGWIPPKQEVPATEEPIVGTGAQEFELRQERQRMMEAQAAEQQQGAMRREARRDLNAGRYLEGVNNKVGERLDKAEAEYDAQKAELDNVKMQIRHMAENLPQIAQQHSIPRDTQSHFALAIAQGLMVAGGRPFVNLVQQAIDNDFRREQAMMHWALEGHKVQLGALSTLAHLTAQMRDPTAVAHMFAALRWQQAQHQLEAFQMQAMGGRKSDEAEQMNKQMEVAKQHELKQAIGSTHVRQWNTVAPQSTPGGLGAFERWVDHNFTDKKQAHEVKQHVLGQIQRGEPITFPKFDANGNITRVDEKIGEQSMNTAVRLPAWLDARQPVVHTHHAGEGDRARSAFDAAETGEMLLKEAEGILRHAGARLSPTYSTELDMVMTQLLSVAKNFDKDGTLKIAELPTLEKRIGSHAIRNITSPADAQAIIDFSRKIMRQSAATQGGVSQMTMTPGGSDYWHKGATKDNGKSFFRPYGGVVEGVTEE